MRVESAARLLVFTAMAALLGGCAVSGRVPDRFLADTATLPDAVKSAQALFNSPQPEWLQIGFGADFDALSPSLGRVDDARVVTGGFATFLRNRSFPGASLVRSVSMNHHYTIGPGTVLATVENNYYQAPTVETLYVLGGLVSLNAVGQDNLADKSLPSWSGYQVTGVSDLQGRLFPLEPGNRMSFTLSGRNQKGDALRSTVRIQVLGQMRNPAFQKVEGPVWLITIERNGLLGTTPEMLYLTDWTRSLPPTSELTRECVVFSESLGWPLARFHAAPEVKREVFNFTQAKAFWNIRHLSPLPDAAIVTQLPRLDGNATNSSLLNQYFPEHRQINLAKPLGRAGMTGLGNFMRSFQAASISAWSAGQYTPSPDIRYFTDLVSAVAKDAGNGGQRNIAETCFGG